jgi:hypothetical protein
MSYLSIANRNMNRYLNIDINDDNDEDIRGIILDEFYDYLISNNYLNLDVIEFEELFKSNDFKKSLMNNNKYHLYIIKKNNQEKINILQNKINILLFLLFAMIIKNLFDNF